MKLSRPASILWAVSMACLLPLLSQAATPSAETALPEEPSFPPLVSLSFQPESLTLHDARDERRVLVWGESRDGDRFDLTGVAEWIAESPHVEAGDGIVRPLAIGEGTVRIAAGGLEARLPVTVKSMDSPPVGFVRDVEPVLSKLGCNAGTCHGSAKGKNGFKLSLRGYDPEFDYQALINDISGRRFNRVDVDQSLMLLKPTADVPHEGGQVIRPGSREHGLLRQWIAEGARFESMAEGRARRIEVMPDEVRLDLPGRRQHLLVLAHYPDGSIRDVTREAIFSSNNDEIAMVNGSEVTAIRRGESAVLIRYEGSYATRLVTVMGDRGGFAWVEEPEWNFIDAHVNAKLRKMRILPSELCTDAEFIRRVSLDLTGRPPRADRVREFLEDPAPSREKRARLTDELIGNGDFVEFWANKWADLLQCNSENLGEKGVWVFRDWIRKSIAANDPYDRFARELLTARGSSFHNPEVNYLRALREPGKMTEDISQTFLGVRFNCNKCHDHPFEKWTQEQYYQFGAYFTRVGFKRGNIGKEPVRGATGDRVPVTAEEIVYRKFEGGEMEHPKTGLPVEPRVPFGEAPEVETDRREAFVEWLTSKDNELFGKAMANRLWSYFLGRGIIEPVDDIRGSNPPGNPELLNALTAEFEASGYDLRHLMRVICNSRTYQRSLRANEWNADDAVNFSHALPRRLSAEQLLDAVAVATGTELRFAGMPAGTRPVELPDGMVDGSDFLALFGRPKRQSACECERTSNVTLSHALSLINGPTISQAVSDRNNRIAKLVAEEPDNRRVIEEIYLAVLNRPPGSEEVAAMELGQGEERLARAQDLTWALINSPAFLFNR